MICYHHHVIKYLYKEIDCDARNHFDYHVNMNIFMKANQINKKKSQNQNHFHMVLCVTSLVFSSPLLLFFFSLFHSVFVISKMRFWPINSLGQIHSIWVCIAGYFHLRLTSYKRYVWLVAWVPVNGLFIWCARLRFIVSTHKWVDCMASLLHGWKKNGNRNSNHLKWIVSCSISFNNEFFL